MDAVLAAKFLSIPTAFFLGSYNFTFSQNVMPHLYATSPSVVAPLFDKIYHRGYSTIAPVAAMAITANAYLAYQDKDPSKQRLYGAAAAFIFMTLPLTQIVMGPGINRLIEIGRDVALQQKSGAEAEVVSLVKSWVAQNYFRSSLHLTAGVLGLFAALS